MESTGLPGAIQVTEAVYSQLTEDRSAWRSRGEIEVKVRSFGKTVPQEHECTLCSHQARVLAVD